MYVLCLKGIFHDGDFGHWSYPGRILIDPGLSQSLMSQCIFLFATLIFVSDNKCLKGPMQLYFVHRLGYAGHCPCKWELEQNLIEFMWDCWLHCLSCSLRLIWECVPGLFFVNVLWRKYPFLESQKLPVI